MASTRRPRATSSLPPLRQKLRVSPVNSEALILIAASKLIPKDSPNGFCDALCSSICRRSSKRLNVGFCGRSILIPLWLHSSGGSSHFEREWETTFHRIGGSFTETLRRLVSLHTPQFWRRRKSRSAGHVARISASRNRASHDSLGPPTKKAASWSRRLS